MSNYDSIDTLVIRRCKPCGVEQSLELVNCWLCGDETTPIARYENGMQTLGWANFASYGWGPDLEVPTV